MNVCYVCGKEVSWAWGYTCPIHGKDVLVCTRDRWNELQELRRLLIVERLYIQAVQFAKALKENGDDEDEYWGQRFLNALEAK